MKILRFLKPKILPVLALLVALISAQVVVPAASADCPGDNSSQSVVLQSVNNETGNNCDSGGVTNTISVAVNILSYVVGAAAIIMIIAAGFRYTTSGGDSNRVSSAKSTLIYALVGLAIAVLAQLLVHFVLSNANGAQPCPTNPDPSKPDVPISSPACKS
jgi:hypothetical protein